MKITDPGFTLPVIEALSLIETFDSGANKPLLITGVDENGKKGDYVVKLRGAERMSVEACMFELLGLFIAKELSINCVSPVIIHISQEFADLLVGRKEWAVATKSIGYNFGSEYKKDGFTTFISGAELNPEELEIVQTIFIFDLFIQNSDRRKEKPNMLVKNKEIIVYDHELSFSFVRELFKNPKPWTFRDSDLSWIKDHIFYQIVKGKPYDFESFSNRLVLLSTGFWQKAWDILPTDWQTDSFNVIKSQLELIVQNRETYIKELQKIMS